MIKELIKDLKYTWEYKDYVDLIIVGLLLILSPILYIIIAHIVCIRYILYMTIQTLRKLLSSKIKTGGA